MSTNNQIIQAYADLSNKSNAGKSYVIFGKTDNTAVNLCCAVGFTEDDIRFTCIKFIA
jgi:hypothetical protein